MGMSVSVPSQCKDCKTTKPGLRITSNNGIVRCHDCWIKRNMNKTHPETFLRPGYTKDREDD